MKKFFLLSIASMMTVFAMAIGRNDGSTKANAIDFDWENPMEHTSGTKWYRVNLDPLYEEETPALNLFLANKDVRDSAHVSLRATVAGQTDEKTFNIAPKQQRVWSANATMLVRLKQKEIYLTLTSDGPVMMSARVFEAADLDETCRDAKVFNWNTGITQTAGPAIWYKVDLKAAKADDTKDVCVIVTNNGSQKLTLYAGQSLDCPSSGVTKRTIELEAGETLRDTVPQSMIAGVAFNELYVSLENNQPITVRAESSTRPQTPVLPVNPIGGYKDKSVPDTATHKNDTLTLSAGTEYYFRYTVDELNALKKYEPEFTFRNISGDDVNISRKMAFQLPAYTAQGNTLVLASGEESVEVLSKNTLLGLEATYIYVKIVADKDIQLISRFKHIREGKACKTNIDFNWDGGHRQDANTTQWYAIDLGPAKETYQDVIVHVNNTADTKASVKAGLAFSCPYIDLQEISRPIAAGDTLSHRMAYSTYGMMSDTVWVSVTTDQEVKFWAELVPTKIKAEVDTICMHADEFDWKFGVEQFAGDTIWYRVNMDTVRKQAAKFPTVFIQNLSTSAPATIYAELSLECPDSIENQKRSLTIAANESYSRQISRNMFENIKAPVVYLRVITTEHVSLQIRLTEEAEGASCSSAIPFNWVSGNTQAANANLWYSVDLRDVMKNGNDIKLHIENKDNAECKGVAQLLYECPTNEPPSTQGFTLGKAGTESGEKSIKVQNSAFEMVEDSAVYVNVQGSTSIRFWVEILPLQPFDTIKADGLTLIPLQWDTLYTQSVDTAWYIIPQSEIAMIRNLDEKVKPVAHLINTTSSAMTIKGEAAFAFPITKQMMTKSQELKANQHFTDTIPAGTFDQFLKKDSIILRVTRPAGAGDFQFRAELVKAFSGNSRYDAQPIRLDCQFNQDGMTSMWYKLNTADLKKTKDLFKKRLTVHTSNAGTADATVKVAVYEGLMSEVDLLEEYGLNDYRERTIKKNEKQDRSFPAQAVYGVGDVELYIQVTTTEPMKFRSELTDAYASIAPDPNQQKAKLLVPNVDYVLPGDNQNHWFMVCMPYIQNNYIYTDSTMLQYEVNGKATIEGAFTFQDTMTYQIPYRTRTINKGGGSHKGKKPVRELIEKGLKKAGHPFDFSGTAPEFMDSLLHRFITKDSVTLYFRVKSNNELKFKLITPQVTGDECSNPTMFDWEHGNVNAAGDSIWYYVTLAQKIDDTTLITRIPTTCDLRLHVDNWGNDTTTATADLYFDCGASKTKGSTHKIAANKGDSIDIDRDFLDQAGWPNMIINYTSDKASHIWAELIPDAPRDTLRDTITRYVCEGHEFRDTITGIDYTIDTYKSWYDTISFESGVMMKDSITLFHVYPIVEPDTMTLDSMKKLNAAPLLVQGMQLNVTASNDSLLAYYRNISAADTTIITIDTVYWAKPKYMSDGVTIVGELPLDLVSYYPKTRAKDTLLLVIKGGCDVLSRREYIIPLEDYKYVTRRDTICPPLTTPRDTITYEMHQHLVPDIDGLPRQIDTIVIHQAKGLPTRIPIASVTTPTVANNTPIVTTGTIEALKAQYESNAEDTTMAVVDAKWQVYVNGAWKDMPYTPSRCSTGETLRYTITMDCGDTLNSDTKFIALSGIAAATADTTAAECTAFTWRGQICDADKDYIDTLRDENGCDTLITTLHFTLLQSYNVVDPTPVAACGSYYWAEADTTIKTVGTADYTKKLTSIHGCDSVVTKTITIHPEYVIKDTVDYACNEYHWAFADSTIYDAGDYTHTEQSIYGCDSTVMLHIAKIDLPYLKTLSIVSRYGDRLLMINRNEINELGTAWNLDIEADTLDVKWYKEATPVDSFLCYGYYLTNEKGTVLDAGVYYAVVDIPATVGNCGAKGETTHYTVAGPAPAPALVPSLARPGEDIRIINLNPEEETLVRIFTAEGLLHGTYTVSGEENFTIKAADAHGFYMVELSNESLQTTLRYIVK